MSIKEVTIWLKNQNEPIRDKLKTLRMSKSTVYYILKKKESSGKLSKVKRSGRPQLKWMIT